MELAIANWTSQARDDVQEIVDAMERATRSADFDTLSQLDQRFHEYFWRIAGSDTLLEVAGNLRGRITRFLREANTSLRSTELAIYLDAHRNWLEAVDSGNLEHARQEVTHQITIAYQRVLARVLECGKPGAARSER